jgi:oxalate decarboxylase/phosphoglucose isomerase-like protein (cupin superfamily)
MSKEENMAKDAIVSDDLAKKFATEKDTPYLRWVRNEGLDIISAHYIQNLRTVELKPWARRGGKGIYINHEASRTSNDCYVCEIAPGKKLEPQRQLFEEMILVLDGRGSTAVWNDAGQKITFEWKAGALFAIPLNAWHQHFNGSGSEPARFCSVTNAPPVINLYEDIDFVFNTAHDFKTRFAGEPDYFSNKGEQKGLLLETNFVPDAVNLPLISAKERGAGGGHIRFNMAKGSMNSHISQFPIGTYKKGHRHFDGVCVFAVTGKGYSLLWHEDDPDFTRIDWEHGCVYCPPDSMFHQHFNVADHPSRYLALQIGTVRYPLLKMKRDIWEVGVDKNVKEGGAQVEYEDQDARIHDMWLKEIAKSGVESRMGKFIDESRFTGKGAA